MAKPPEIIPAGTPPPIVLLIVIRAIAKTGISPPKNPEIIDKKECDRSSKLKSNSWVLFISRLVSVNKIVSIATRTTKKIYGIILKTSSIFSVVQLIFQDGIQEI